jgi:catechol 2,3-dioxygenase
MTIRPVLTHTGVYTRDLEAMTAFYQQVIGLIVTDRGIGVTVPQALVFLSSDPAHHHQFVLSDGRPADAPSTVNQISFLVQSLGGLREVMRRAQDFGLTKFRTVNHGNAWSLYFDDPEENLLEIYAETEWYVPQPFADRLDLALPDDEIIEQTRVRCLQDPGVMPVEQWRATLREKLAVDAG